MTRRELAARLALSTKVLDYHIRKFKRLGLLERLSPEGSPAEWRLYYEILPGPEDPKPEPVVVTSHR